MNMRGFKQLQEYLIELHKTKSLRQISGEEFNNEVSHGVIHRCIKGVEPRDNEIRKRLGLPIITYQYKDSVTGQFVEKS